MENSPTNPPTSVLSALIPANPTAAWTPGPHSLNWTSDTYTVSRAQISDCVISDPNLYPVGGAKEFSQEPLGSMQALLDFGEEHREAGRPLFILMGGWTKQKEVDKDANMCVQTFRFCDHDGKLYSFAFVYTGALHQADGTRRCPRWMAYALEQQVNLALGFSRIESECHPRITNMHVGGNGPPIELCNKLGKPGECGWVAVAVGVEQPAAGRAGIVSLEQQKSLEYLAMMVGCKNGNVKLLPTCNQRIKWLQEWVKAHGGQSYLKTAVQVSTPMLFGFKNLFSFVARPSRRQQLQ